MLRLSPLIVCAWLAATAAAGWYTATHIDVNTDTEGLISSDLPFRKAYEEYRQKFPLQSDSLVVVIDGQTPEQAEAGAIALGEALRARKDLFSDVDVPGTGRFFSENAFLYLSDAELQDLSSRLVDAQPFIGLIERDPSLRGFANTLTQVLSAPAGNSLTGLAPVLVEFRRAVDAEMRSKPYQLSWQKMLAGTNPAITLGRRFVLARPILDTSDMFAAGRPMEVIRQAAATRGLTPDQGVRVRITGDAALSYEELQSALQGTKISNGFALIIVTILLAYGLRSVWLTLASLITLIVGLVATATFATVAVGRLNLISLAFAVLYIGLSVDYAINFCLRYREWLQNEPAKKRAIAAATRDVAKPLAMCALTTCIGFYAFLPTDFSGVAELGLISGTGMIINLAVTLTLLPALLSLLPQPRAVAGSVLLPGWYRTLPYRFARPICWGALALGLLAAVTLPRVTFDRNPLNLRAANSESVSTIRDLMADHEHPVMSITVLAHDSATARRQAAKLRQLPEVDQVITVSDFIPEVTDAKLATLDELSLLVAPALEPGQPDQAPDAQASASALEALTGRLRKFAAAGTSDENKSAASLADALDKLLADTRSLSGPRMAARLSSLEHRLLATLPVNLDRLRLALQPRDSSKPALPADIASRWVSPDGTERISVFPKEDIGSNAALRRFVDAVQSVAPDATDEPVLNLRAGDTVVGAFVEAIALATVGIAIVVLVLLRSLRAALLVATPLVLGAVLTGATMVLLGVPFNFANVMALPLLLGVSVDFGILIVQRMYQHPPVLRDPLATSTAKAVLFSGLATTCGIGNLVLSPHPGTASMGLLLSIGLSWSVLCTLVVLPAFAAVRGLRAGQ